MPLNDSGNRRQEHLSLMAAKYQQLPHFLRPLREAPSRQTLPVSGEGENPPCILSLAEANDLESMRRKMINGAAAGNAHRSLLANHPTLKGRDPVDMSSLSRMSLKSGAMRGPEEDPLAQHEHRLKEQ